MKNIKFIIPCVGTGTRMNMKFDQSKEMLPDPSNDNKPLIRWHLDNLQKFDFPILIITRKEKIDLIEYVKNIKNIELIILDEITKEWPETILKSKNEWSDINILILPDTRFKPLDTLDLLIKESIKNSICFCVHKVDDIRNWGKVLLDPFSHKVLNTQEKSDIKFKLDGLAWGLISYEKHLGEALFKAYLDRTIFDLTKIKTSCIILESFKDITRTGKIESYE